MPFPPLKPASLGSASEPDLSDAASTASSPLSRSAASAEAGAPTPESGDSESVDSSAGTYLQREADLSSLSDMTSDSEADLMSSASPRLASESDVDPPAKKKTKNRRPASDVYEEASESSSEAAPKALAASLQPASASSDGSDYEPMPSNASV